MLTLGARVRAVHYHSDHEIFPMLFHGIEVPNAIPEPSKVS